MVAQARLTTHRSQLFQPRRQISWWRVLSLAILSVIASLVVAAYVARDQIAGNYVMNNREALTAYLGNEKQGQRLLVPLLGDLADRDNAESSNRFSGLYFAGIWQNWQTTMDRFRPGSNPESPLAGQEILEIGCGESLAQGVLAVRYGAKRYTCVEIGDSVGRHAPESYLTAIAMVRAIRGRHAQVPQREVEKIFRIEDGRVVFNPDLIRLITAPNQNYYLPDLVPEGSFDLIVSTSLLEHVADPRGMIRQMCVVLKRGGLMTHSFNVMDHDKDRSDPYRFLRTPKMELATLAVSGYHENQWRPHQYRMSAEENGFRILSWRTNLDVPNLFDYYGHNNWSWFPVTDEIRLTFAEPWQSMTNEELSAVAAWFVAEKVGNYCGD